MKIVLIGAGNLATNICYALLNAGHDILQVYSRTQKSADDLARKVGCSAVSDLKKVSSDADVYIVSVKDSVISDLLPALCSGNKREKVFFHTAGSVPMDIFKGVAIHYGVLYPMQTFSKSRIVIFDDIPCFIEGNDDLAFETISTISTSISNKVYALSSESRMYLHLAAVFACNFVNHCYEISSEILSKQNIPFEVMLPLIDETAKKVHELKPIDAQTGPAVRYDQNIIKKQMELLNENPHFKQIYEDISLSIHNVSENNKKV